MTSGQSPQPPTPPADSPPRPTWRKALDFAWSHKGKIGAWVLGGGLSAVDQWLFCIVPVSDEIRPNCIVATVILAFVAVIFAGLIAWTIHRALRPVDRLWAYAFSLVASLLMALACYPLYLWVDAYWKKGDLAEESVEAIILFWQPAAYGLIFGFLAEAIVSLLAFGKEVVDLHDAAVSQNLTAPPPGRG